MGWAVRLSAPTRVCKGVCACALGYTQHASAHTQEGYLVRPHTLCELPSHFILSTCEKKCECVLPRENIIPRQNCDNLAGRFSTAFPSARRQPPRLPLLLLLVLLYLCRPTHEPAASSSLHPSPRVSCSPSPAVTLLQKKEEKKKPTKKSNLPSLHLLET